MTYNFTNKSMESHEVFVLEAITSNCLITFLNRVEQGLLNWGWVGVKIV